jgi:hypothetical protein
LVAAAIRRDTRFFLTSLPHIFLFTFMKKPYNLTAGFTRRLRQLGLTATLVAGTAALAQAQNLSYPVGQASTSAGTYTDLGTTGTVIATTNTDDANSAAQDIGFTFSYGGATFTQFVFNTNGVIRLGSAAPSTAALYFDNDQNNPSTDPLQSTNAADNNLIMPFNINLVPGSGTGGGRVPGGYDGHGPEPGVHHSVEKRGRQSRYRHRRRQRYTVCQFQLPAQAVRNQQRG